MALAKAGVTGATEAIATLVLFFLCTLFFSSTSSSHALAEPLVCAGASASDGAGTFAIGGVCVFKEELREEVVVVRDGALCTCFADTRTARASKRPGLDRLGVNRNLTSTPA